MWRMWHIGSIGETKLQLHWTILLWIQPAVIALALGDPGRAVVHFAVAMLLAVSVVLHELAHAYAAKSYGLSTSSITLSMIGGVAVLKGEDPGEWTPRRAVAIALGGPAVSLVLAIAFTIPLLACELSGFDVRNVANEPAGFLCFIGCVVNLVLLAFNMLPIYPMDGGQALRGFLAMFIGAEWSTWLMLQTGRLLAVGLVVYGLCVCRVNLCLIGVGVVLVNSVHLRGCLYRREFSEQPKADSITAQ